MRDYIKSQIKASILMLSEVLSDEDFLFRLESAVRSIVAAIKNNNKILLIGNGGSAADAQHIAAEFVSRLRFDRVGLPAISLTTDTSILTAIGNDYGFDNLFARQVQAYAQPGDILIAYSTSGKSPNVIAALEQAKRSGIVSIGMTGNLGGPMKDLCDHYLDIPSSDTPKIQEGHAVIGHIICGLVEESLFELHS